MSTVGDYRRGAMVESDRFPRRAARARETRRRVCRAATELFVERGYAATSVAAIAAAADVAEQTVYAAFGTKRAVLLDALDMAIAGDDRPIAVNDRDWMSDVWQAPDPASRLRAYAQAVRRIHDGAARMFRALELAVAADPELREAYEEAMRRRRTGVTGVVGPIGDAGQLAPGLTTGDAIDIVWSLNGHEVYSNLVDGCGWTPTRYAAWLGDTLVAVLLPSESDRVAEVRRTG